jgi:hypothetical protein
LTFCRREKSLVSVGDRTLAVQLVAISTGLPLLPLLLTGEGEIYRLQGWLLGLCWPWLGTNRSASTSGACDPRSIFSCRKNIRLDSVVQALH